MDYFGRMRTPELGWARLAAKRADLLGRRRMQVKIHHENLHALLPHIGCAFTATLCGGDRGRYSSLNAGALAPVGSYR